MEIGKIFLIIRHMQPIYLKKDTNYLTNNFQRKIKTDEQLSKENKDRLKSLPLCCELYVSGRLVRMFHATPNSSKNNVLAIDRIDKIYKQFLPTKYTSNEIADIVIYAHTHTQNLMKLYNRTLINVGSVGNAFDIIRNKEKDGRCENTTNADYFIM